MPTLFHVYSPLCLDPNVPRWLEWGPRWLEWSVFFYLSPLLHSHLQLLAFQKEVRGLYSGEGYFAGVWQPASPPHYVRPVDEPPQVKYNIKSVIVMRVCFKGKNVGLPVAMRRLLYVDGLRQVMHDTVITTNYYIEPPDRVKV